MLKNRQTLLFLGDILVLVLAFCVMVALRFDVDTQGEVIRTQTYSFALLFILWLIVLYVFDLYNLRRVNPNPRTIGTLALAIVTSTLLSGVIFYLFPVQGITPKTNLAIIAVSAFVLLVGWRRLFYNLFASTYTQKIAVIGSDPAIDHLLADLAKHPHIGTVVEVQKAYDKSCRLPTVHLVIADNVSLECLMHITETTGAEILSLIGAYEELFGKIPLSLMTDERAIAIMTNQRNSAYALFERIIELLVATTVLIITLPILLLAVIAILIEDGGPVLYRQSRVGKNGTIFQILKLRSMTKTAEANGAQWAATHDARVTRIGRILRKTHIDEIPQMYNIIRGDIALIGPRAERPEFVTTLERDIPYYSIRHTAKPGFTGWAQIKFHYARTTEESREKFEYDLYYLKNKNPLLDLGILLKTIQIIFTH